MQMKSRLRLGILGTGLAIDTQPEFIRMALRAGKAVLSDVTRVTLYDERGKVTPFDSSVNSFCAQFDHVADVVKRGVSPQVTPQAALLDLAFMQSIVGS